MNDIMPIHHVAHVEALERRRLFTVDLTFGDFALSGAPLFQPGKTSEVVALMRNLGNNAATGYNVTFNAIDVGFKADTKASFDDANAVQVPSSFTSASVPAGAVGQSITFTLKFPPNFKPGRYALVGKVSVADDTRASNDTRLFAVARSLPNDGNLIVDGTAAADSITLAPARSGSRVNVIVDDYTESFSAERISAFTVRASGGNDAVVVIGAVSKVSIDGGDGNDKLVGGANADTLAGRAGNDTIYGGGGGDRLDGDGGSDRLFGEDGVDRLFGGNGNDQLDAGAASDRLDGGKGVDTLFGQGGNDRFFTRDSAIDQLFGGSGIDTATADATDIFSSI
jgi:Ca2+-binding RTX toxin-like protein